VSAPGDPIEACCHQHRPELPAAGQGCLESRTSVVLARGDVLVLDDQGPALALDEGTDAGLLCLQAQARVPLLGRGDAVQRDGMAGLVGSAGRSSGHQPCSSVRTR
jgi:hypothetical protein